MSRGFGKLQNVLLNILRQHGKPMTFAAMRDHGSEPGTKLDPTFQRSVRRALASLVKNEMLIAIGDGGPADPHRYFYHPMAISFLPENRQQALYDALEAEPGGYEAATKALGKMTRRSGGAEPSAEA